MADKPYRKQIEEIMSSSDPRLNKRELLEDLFKMSVAKLLEHSIMNGQGEKGDRLEMDALMTSKSELIREFRGASLDSHQKTVEQYEKLFQTAMEEIFNDASLAHEGQDSVSLDKNQQLEVNPDAYVNEGGIYVPSHMKN